MGAVVVLQVMLLQRMQEHGTIPPLTHTHPRAQTIHALLKGSSYGSQSRDRAVASSGTQWQGTLQGTTKPRDKTTPAWVHSSLGSLVQQPGCDTDLGLQACILLHA